MNKILIVDDERFEREQLCQIVEEAFPHAVQTRTAENGRQAVETAALWSPGIILMDIEMPGLNGIEAAKRILNQLPGCRIIETSSMDLMNIGDIIAIILSDEKSVKAPIAEQNQGFAFEKAKLGWYSGTSDLIPKDDLDMYGMATDLMRGVAKVYDPESIVHVKVMLESEDAACKMSLVQQNMQVDGIVGSRYMRKPGKLVLNARVISPPRRLEEVMRGIIEEASKTYPIELVRTGEKCFMPKPESPSHFFFE